MTANLSYSEFFGYRRHAARPTAKTRGWRLQVCQEYDHYIRIWIPTTTEVRSPVDTSQWVKRANRLFVKFCGGSTCKHHVGFYESERFGLVTERVFEVEAWTNDMGLKQVEPELDNFLIEMLLGLGQETAFMAVDGQGKLLKLAV
jgi:hypothetical protein